MAVYKNQGSQKIAVFAYTASTGAAKTGDAANITAYLSKDWGAAAAVTDTNPTEIDATNMPGWYAFDLTQAETNAEVLVIAPKSATAGVVIDQVQVFTDSLSTARAGYLDNLNGHTPQTGDTYARVGANGAGLTALPWNAAWDAEVQSEAADAITAAGLSTLDAAGVRGAVGLASANLDTQLADVPTVSELNARTIVSADYATAAALTAVDDLLDTEIGAIKAKTDNLPADPADQSAVEAAITAAAASLATAANLATLAGYVDTEVAAILAAVDTEIAAILADTNELQMDWTNGGRLDLILDDVKLDTGTMIPNSLTTRASQASVDDLPTNAELATALGTADDATIAAIAALNNLSSAGAQAAAAAALLAYNAATEGDVTGLSIPTAGAVADAVWDEALAGHLTAGSTGDALDGAGGGGGGSSASDIWSYATRTLTAATVAGPGGAISGADITLYRGDSFSVSFTGLGDLTGRSKLWFTAKRRSHQADTEAQIQVIEATGLAYIAGAAGTPANGALTVTDAATGAATLTLDEVETAKLSPESGWAWDVQMRTAGGVVTTLAVGTLAVTADVTRATT